MGQVQTLAATTGGRPWVPGIPTTGLHWPMATPTMPGIMGLVEKFAVEAGTNDLQRSPVQTGGRCVIAGFEYGGQTA